MLGNVVIINVKLLFPASGKTNITCLRCGEEISLEECFKDRAAENELKTAIIKCANQDCPWEGPGQYYKVNN